MEELSTFATGSSVRSERYGTGTVEIDKGTTLIVRFDHGLEECRKTDLHVLPSLGSLLRRDRWDNPLEVITRAQAEAIVSVNDAWGVFARSRIALLPHQLWVCREVIQEWPTRWLVADDVGLGKTIEAGILLTPLLASGKVRRLLILCPASLVEQWQERLRTMFDIRLAMYTSEADTPRSDFWHTHHQVVVSMHTLRADTKGRHERLCESDPWDLVVVDESHHLNADEESGPTLAYQLVKKLGEQQRVHSMVFFTGTPHRGKTFGFLAQLQLLRPDIFDPRRPLREQLPRLREVVIRNNKYNVTDLRGHRLFQEPVVHMETYQYSPQEQLFYDTLTDFILRGRTYASGLSKADASAVMLVLIAMQKLASSSVAAIRRAIQGRLLRMTEGRRRLDELKKVLSQYEELLDGVMNDRVGELEEELAYLGSALKLMEDEEPALRQLLELAQEVTEETKIRRIKELVAERYADRTVLFFTEYKATQSLLMSSLIATYGDACVTFINGDGRAEGVRFADGTVRTVTTPRQEAADAFNAGKVRFLVSTEAAGEGIDLQEQCHTLIHVDLPWNPMRMHQRVGRLNRYGQQHRVEVLSIRNPSTVEARIWDKLDEKLDRINEAFAHVMETPEDLRQLVLGAASPRLVQRLFADAIEAPPARVESWFDEQTATFGGKDVVDMVQALVGSVHKFDFQQVSPKLPQVDLPDLKPFFETVLALNARRPTESDGRMTFLTPESWRTSPAIRARYEGMSFDRSDRAPDVQKRLLGVGHKAFDAAIAEARARDSFASALPPDVLAHPVLVFRLQDRVTDSPNRPAMTAAVAITNTELQVLADWRLLKLLNQMPLRKEVMRIAAARPAEAGVVEAAIERARSLLMEKCSEWSPGYRVPYAELLVVLWPASPEAA